MVALADLPSNGMSESFHAACHLLGLEEFNTADTTQFTSARRFALWAGHI
jgi:hypothetical protein